MAANLFSEIEFLKGVGKAKGEKYRKLGCQEEVYGLVFGRADPFLSSSCPKRR